MDFWGSVLLVTLACVVVAGIEAGYIAWRRSRMR
jgi:hypothetical protein